MNSGYAWHFLERMFIGLGKAVSEISLEQETSAGMLSEKNPDVAAESAYAAECLCKSFLALHGIEPRRPRSVDQLCDQIRRHMEEDPLLPLLEECNGDTEKAPVGTYVLRLEELESREVSETRIARVMDIASMFVPRLAQHSDDPHFNTEYQARCAGRVRAIAEALEELRAEPRLNRIRSALAALLETFRSTLPELAPTVRGRVSRRSG